MKSLLNGLRAHCYADFVENTYYFTCLNQNRGNLRYIWIQFFQQQKPVFAFGCFFSDNGNLMEKIAPRFSAIRFTVISADSCCWSGKLIFYIAWLNANGDFAKCSQDGNRKGDGPFSSSTLNSPFVITSFSQKLSNSQTGKLTLLANFIRLGELISFTVGQLDSLTVFVIGGRAKFRTIGHPFTSIGQNLW